MLVELEWQLRCDSWCVPQMFSTNKRCSDVQTRERGGPGPAVLIALIYIITSSAGISRLRAGEPKNHDSISRPRQDIFFSKDPKPFLQPTQPSVQ